MKAGAHPFEQAPVRTAVRFPLHMEITLWAEDRSYPAVTENISSNGVLFSAEEVPPVGTRVTFRVAMPASLMGGTEGVWLDCVGRIVRHAASNGRQRAAAVIDEYLLRSEPHES